MNIKLSLSLLALENFYELEKFLSILKRNRIKYVELPISKILPKYKVDKKKIKFFLKTLKKYKIKVSSVQAIYYGKNLNVLNSAQFKKNFDHLKQIIRISKLLKVNNIIFGSPLNRKKNNLSLKKSNKNFQKLLSKIDNILSKNKIYFLIEPNSKHYKCDYLINTNEVLNFLKKNNFKNIFINLDTGNALLENDKILINKRDKQYFKNFQISEKNLLGLSSNKEKHKKILRKFILKNNFISLEMLNIDINKLDNNIKKFKIITKNI